MPRRLANKDPSKFKAGQAVSVFAAAAGSQRFALDRRLSAVRQISDVLRTMIMTLELEPGAVISKDDVARAFGVSSMPVRQAFRKLEEDGLLVIKPQSGTYVAAIDTDLARAAQVLRIAIEIEVARIVCQTATEAEFKKLDQRLLHAKLEFDAGDWEAFNRIDMDFHALLCSMAGVPVLWQKIGEMRVHIDRLRRMYLPVSGDMSRNQTEHKEILDALRARDPGRAEAALRQHLSYTLSAIAKLREEKPQYFQSLLQSP